MHQSGTSNSVVRLSRTGPTGPLPTRIASLRASPRPTPRAGAEEMQKVRRSNIGAFGVSRLGAPSVRNRAVDVPVKPDMKGVRRIIDAIAVGEDPRIAAQRPSSILSRACAAVLLPLLLISPIAAAASEDVPLPAQIAAEVTAVVSGAPAAKVPEQTSSATPLPTPVADTSKENVPVTPATLSANTDTHPEVSASATSSGNPVTPETPTTPDQVSSSTPVATPPAGEGTSTSTSTPNTSSQVNSSASGGGSSAGGASNENATTTVAEAEARAIATTSSTTIKNENKNEKPAIPSIPADDPLATSSLLDAAPPEQQQSLDDIRAQLRLELRGEVEQQIHSEMKDSVRDEVRMELERSVEKKMLDKCTKVPDGSGVYCVSNIDAFGTKTETSDAVSVTSAPNPIDHNKEIYLTRGASTWKLTSNPDDDTNPSLDPVGNILVWQAMNSGRAQINWADMSEAKPSVHVLTNGENNFYPKAYAGRIVWQAWIGGNWEIVWAELAKTVVPDGELSPENKALGVSGDWLVHRVTHNSAPDMFPTINRDGVSWQGVDGGVWQVFTYDFESSKTLRVSRPGVTSEAPESAMVWTERDGAEMRLVGRSLDGTKSIDFTDVARHLGSKDTPAPKAPVNDTQMIVAPGTIKVEESAASTTPVLQ